MAAPYTISYHGAHLNEAALQTLEAPLAALKQHPPASVKAILDSCSQEAAGLDSLLASWEGYRHLLVIGAGGSGLSSKALAMLATGKDRRRTERQVHVLDTVDPAYFQHVMQRIDPEEAAFVFISKSGSTVETLALTHLLLRHLQQQAVSDLARRTAIITMAGTSPMHALADSLGCDVFEHDGELCGRFSLLSITGQIAAGFCGLDTKRLLAGARETFAAMLNQPVQDCPAALAAVQMIDAAGQGKNMQVFMPYSKALEGLSLWWRQSWAESLGKDGQGTTPVQAVGTTDQHSQLQLYLDGPDDKFYSFVLPEHQALPLSLPKLESELSYLSYKQLGELMSAQQEATALTLIDKGRPVRLIRTGPVDEYLFGALFAQLTLEIVLVAELLGINAFDQPAVESGKVLARRNLEGGAA